MNTELFKEGLKKLSGNITDKQIFQFEEFSRLLVDWNTKMNLTAVTDPDGIAVKHFLDSILPIYYTDINSCESVADVGTGAGFPGIPLAIMLPDVKFTLIDSLNKRINFLNEVCEKLELKNTICIHGRAEELGKDKKYREKFDAVVSRAVANMTVLSEYCIPYVKVGGEFVALKASNCEEELSAAKAVIGELGGRTEKIISAPLPKSDIVRTLAVIKKEKATPSKFPRRADKIKKSQKQV